MILYRTNLAFSFTPRSTSSSCQNIVKIKGEYGTGATFLLASKEDMINKKKTAQGQIRTTRLKGRPRNLSKYGIWSQKHHHYVSDNKVINNGRLQGYWTFSVTMI